MFLKAEGVLVVVEKTRMPLQRTPALHGNREKRIRIGDTLSTFIVKSMRRCLPRCRCTSGNALEPRSGGVSAHFFVVESNPHSAEGDIAALIER